MRRLLLCAVAVVLVAGLAAASTASFGDLRREAIRAVSACRNMATVCKQLDGLAADVQTESKAVGEGTSGRIAVVRERLEVIDGKVGELERKHAELQEIGASIQAMAASMKAGAAPVTAAAGAGGDSGKAR